MKPIQQRDEETMVLSDAVKVLMTIKGCSAQVALDEILQAWKQGDLPIMAQLIKKEKDACD